MFERQSFAASQLFRGIHGPPTIFRAAIAWGLFFIAVVQAVVVAKLLAGCDIADGHDPHPAIDFLGLTIRIARVIDKHGDAVAINHFGAVADTEQIGDGLVFVAAVGLFLVNQRARVFDHTSAFRDGRSSVTTGGVDEGGANDEAHTYVGSRTWSIAAALARIFRERADSTTQTSDKTSRIVGMKYVKESRRRLPMLAVTLLFGSMLAWGQQDSQSPPPDAPPANAQKQSSQSSPSTQTKTTKSQNSSKTGSKSTPGTDPAASNPFPMAQSEAAAKADAQQEAPQSSEPMQNSTSPNPGTQPPATSNPSRKSGQSLPAKDNPFPEAQSKAAAKADQKQGGEAGTGSSPGSGIPQPGSSSSSKGGYSSSDAHLPEPDVGEGNLGTHPKLDSFTRDQNPDGRVDDDLNTADLYMKNGNYRGGYVRYQDVLQFDPTNDTALYGLADALCKENQTSEAMAHFKSYAISNPQGKYARKAEKMLAHPEKCMHNH